MRKSFYLLVILFLLGSCASGPLPAGPASSPGTLSAAPSVLLGKALEEIRFGRRSEAIPLLAEIRRRNQGTDWAARASFLLGLDELERGGQRAVLYLQEAQALGIIRPHVLLRLARAYRAAGATEESGRAYDSIEREYPGFSHMDETLVEHASVLEEMGHALRALELYHKAGDRSSAATSSARALLAAARIEMATGRNEDAGHDLRRILVEYPGTRAAKRAERLLRENRRLGLSSLSRDERCRRAEALFRSYHYEEAVDELSALLRRDSRACDGGAEGLALEALFRLKRYAKAEEMLRERLERQGKDPAGRRELSSHALRSTLLRLATVYLREGKGPGFLSAVKDLTRAFPQSHEAWRALFMEAAYYESAGRMQKALGLYGRVLRTGGRRLATEAAWRRGWLLYRMGRYREAYESLRTPGANVGSMAPRFAYWRGRALDKAGYREGALREYAAACSGWMPGYYCFMAQERMGLRDGAEEAGPGSTWKSAPLPGMYGEAVGEERFRKALVLLSVGLSEDAAREADEVLKAGRPGRRDLLMLMRAFYSAGDYYHALRLFENYAWILRERDGTMPPELMVMAFPLKLVEYMGTRGLTGEADPLLVAAVMREESSFDPSTVSRTGAVGLMQVMPSTAEFIARASSRGRPTEYDLGDPETNIRMGAWYLAYLWRRTKGDVIETIAGYNAGLNMVRKWRRTFPLEDDEFIESIPYEETRNYTKKVLKSYRAFTMLVSKRRPSLLSSREDAGKRRINKHFASLEIGRQASLYSSQGHRLGVMSPGARDRTYSPEKHMDYGRRWSEGL